MGATSLTYVMWGQIIGIYFSGSIFLSFLKALPSCTTWTCIFAPRPSSPYRSQWNVHLWKVGNLLFQTHSQVCALPLRHKNGIFSAFLCLALQDNKILLSGCEWSWIKARYFSLHKCLKMSALFQGRPPVWADFLSTSRRHSPLVEPLSMVWYRVLKATSEFCQDGLGGKCLTLSKSKPLLLLPFLLGFFCLVSS